jgi:hypothetical protein
VVRYNLQNSFGVMRTKIEGRKMVEIEYGKDERGLSFKVPSIEAAQAEADRRNGRAAGQCTAEEFVRRTEHVPMYAKTRDALHAIMVEGVTWREAAERHGVTESGILRAMRRVSTANAG